jgi:AcrR family transcriptional regulator
VAAAERLLRRGGGGTVEQVAREARCAKGLVHYHFRTKGALLAAATARLGEARQKAWREAFRARSPQLAIERSWQLLFSESRNGTVRAWTSLYAQTDHITGRAVSEQIAAYGRTLADAAGALLGDLGLAPTIPTQEIGWLLAGVVHGMGLQLEVGAPPDRLQGAYSAAWLGVLSLTRPGP